MRSERSRERERELNGREKGNKKCLFYIAVAGEGFTGLGKYLRRLSFKRGQGERSEDALSSIRKMPPARRGLRPSAIALAAGNANEEREQKRDTWRGP